MIQILPNASNLIYENVAKWVGRQKSYGPPAIFYWLCKLKNEIEMLDTLTEIEDGHHRYRLGHSMGVIRFISLHIKDEQVFFVTDIDFNTRSIPKWQRYKRGKDGLIEHNKRSSLDTVTVIKKIFEYNLF